MGNHTHSERIDDIQWYGRRKEKRKPVDPDIFIFRPSHSPLPQTLRTHAEALRAFLTTSLLCFLATIVLKRSKSESDRLAWVEARFCAHALLSHLSTMASFSRSFFRWPEPAARGRPVILREVRVTCFKGKLWRLTPVVGPSMTTCKIVIGQLVGICRGCGRTRFWSMISVMAAILPEKGPLLRRTIRPTSTKRVKLDSYSQYQLCLLSFPAVPSPFHPASSPLSRSSPNVIQPPSNPIQRHPCLSMRFFRQSFVVGRPGVGSAA